MSGPALNIIGRAATVGCGDIAANLNFCRRKPTAGKVFSFLRIPFVDHCSEAANSITHAFRFSPVVVGQVHLSQSASGAGLVVLGDGHTIAKRKPKCPNQVGTNPYQNGAKS
ncbi:hypothetical protein [Mesorhizobium sp. M4B.F.Ca.ET.143.01.1.1]|uniref:hypothetical protein n=1 Tax=Mesorhizobium sp. M4B.F.Ca.ET.143.01.1.1 TaxID=2563947 RepID=UPI001677C69A|nr:hypothetical protein [Mesorhizobium sp. M4B.F.Ca.ET.143.01.1.1]